MELQFKLKFRFYLIIFFTVLFIGTIGFSSIENLSLIDSLYFTFVTIATVGYGDISPVTMYGKLLAIFIIVMGVGTFLGVIANATEIMLHRREKETRLKKQHMVIGIFFSEVGHDLLVCFSNFDPNLDNIKEGLIVKNNWTEENFLSLRKHLGKYNYTVDNGKVDLESLNTFLLGKKSFLLGLLQNPILLEHESFTDLLQAVFHLTEELACRVDISSLPESDVEHLENDIVRSYNYLVFQWVDYMQHLKNHYPFLFSFAMRTNPFDNNATVIIR